MTVRSALWPLFAVLALAAALNFYRLDSVALWNDEAFSFFAAQHGISHAIAFISDDTQPPFYYLVLSAWLNLGHGVFAIRALSALATTLAVLPVYAAARRLFGIRAGLLAGLLFAIAPMSIGWAHRARPYPLQTMLVAFAFWGFVTICLEPAARRQIPGTGRKVDLAWATYVVCGALAMLAQHPAGFFILGCNAGMALIVLRDWGRSRLLLANWIGAQILMIAIWAAWLPAMLHQVAEHLTPEQIAAKHDIFLVSGQVVFDNIRGVFGIGGLWRLSVVFGPLYAAVAAFAVFKIVRRDRVAEPLLAPVIVPIAACVAGFAFVHPVFGYVIGNFGWILAPYSALLAFGMLSIKPAFLRYAVIATAMTGCALGARNVYQTETPPLDRVAAALKAGFAPGDGILLGEHSSGRWGIAYYMGEPYLPALDVGRWGDERLLHAPAQAAGLKRIWMVVIDGERPAIDPSALHMRPTPGPSIGAFQITRLDACGPDEPC